MQRLRLPIGLCTLGLVALLCLEAGSSTQQPPAQEEGVQVQARGPVHEAFAQPTDTQPQPGPVAKKKPPEPIEEMPPDQKPLGDNVLWISGYWAWDEEDNDFLWVSGCWRDTPPGRRWLPGHWQEVDGGWMYSSGIWVAADRQEVQYVPQPPPSVEVGPSTPAPNATSIYAPGSWMFRENRFFWRPGFWVVYQPGWVWIPAYYVWTPCGCVLVGDHWDYPWDDCGLLFAPVRFNLAVWGRFNRPFVPRYVVHADFLLGSLFVGPRHRHYFFGDFFDARYTQRGFVAWTDHRPGPGAIDPMFAYYRQLHAAEPKWDVAMRDFYRARKSGEIPRPPKTLTEQVNLIGKIKSDKSADKAVSKGLQVTNLENVQAIVPLNEVSNAKLTRLGSLTKGKESKAPPVAVKLKTISKDEQAQSSKTATQMREAAKQRIDVETQLLNKGGVTAKSADKAMKLSLPKVVTGGTPPGASKKLPATITLPKQEDRPIPKFDPPKPPDPPKGNQDKDKKDKKDKKDNKKG